MKGDQYLFFRVYFGDMETQETFTTKAGAKEFVKLLFPGVPYRIERVDERVLEEGVA